MLIHELTQGTPEWLAYRATHFNASDAPAMLGLSDYKTRNQLLRELATGLTPDVDPSTQARFDAGHRFEALARPLAEAIIGEDLYPVTGSDGKLSASFDGLTMLEDVNFEHKTLNSNLRAIMVDGCSGADLDLQYQVQMEQQMMVSGASKTLFMASQWATQEDVLIEERHCWYESNLELRKDIEQGWVQFAIDLEAYVPPAVVIEAVGRTPETLPALRIEVTGMVTASNLAQYKEHALAVFEGINRDLKTDQDFADADKIVKWCGDVEDRLSAAKQHALSQTESIDALFRTIDDISAEARRTRLELDKLVKARKEQVRCEIVQEGVAAIAAHITALNQRLGKPYMPAIPADFAGAIKGKRSIDSIRDAVNTLLANTTIQASAIADRIQTNLNTLRELAANYAFLFADTAQIVLKANDDLTMLVKSRIADHAAAESAKEEAQRARIRAEEQAKAEREAREKLAAEQAAVDKLAREHAQLERDEISRLAKLNMTMVVEVPPVVTHAAVVEIMMPPAVRQAMKPKVGTPPTLALGEISSRLGFNCTSAFLAVLGFEATTVKAAKLFHEEDFPAICRALIEHISEVSEQFDAVSA